MSPPRVIAIGASWGGLEAISGILGHLPPTLEACVLIAQHRGRGDDEGLSRALGRHSALPVQEAEDKEPLVAGRAFLAPADYHLLADGDRVSLSVDAPVNFARPSIDVLFESVADALGTAAVGVLLTGLGRDGAAGLRRISTRGGTTVVQEPGTAVSPALPRSALELFAPSAVLPLPDIAAFLVRAIRG